MADALDLGSSAARRGGSSPPSRIPNKWNRAAAEIGAGSIEILADLQADISAVCPSITSVENHAMLG
jgi:hypothetical protein